jgi:MoaA/NifB/PqqE/SkfB family radical SAM enzyme
MKGTMTSVRRKVKGVQRKFREARMFARAMASPRHPILAQIIPTRRCNLSCTYCNEYDRVSEPVPREEMLRRIDKLGALGTAIITLSGGEPTLHPDLDELIARIRSHNAIATVITNGLLLTPDRILGFNRAGLDYLQISIDNVTPDEVSKKSLRVLDRKLQWLAEYAEFGVTINSVLGSGVTNPEDAYVIAHRARELGFTSTVGVLHDHGGQLVSLKPSHQNVYDRITSLGKSLFSFVHHDAFQSNIARGLPNSWHCPAGGRFLYICEDGLVHYCSQQRGRPGIPLADYTVEDLVREGAAKKGCAPFCTISCVHQTAFLDNFRTQPADTLAGIIERRKQQDPSFQVPLSVRALAWMFLHPERKQWFGKAAMRVFGLEHKS